jgi:hypothetical protein
LVLAVALASATDAFAAAQRTFVASTGNDANACSLAFPCRSFGVAIAQTLPGGEVIVLDSAGYGPATISQPVSIIAPPGIYAGVSVFSGGPTGGVGLIVNVGSGEVTLRGLTINGFGANAGIEFLSGTALYLDNATVSNFGIGLWASVDANASVFVTDSTFHDNFTGAIFETTAGTLTTSIESVLFARNSTGLSFRDGTAGSVHSSTLSGGQTGISVVPLTATRTATIEVRGCTISDHFGDAVEAMQLGAGSPRTLVSVVSSLLSGNGIGVQVTGVNTSGYVSDSMITRNAIGVSSVGGGEIVSGGDNRLVGNTADGSFSSAVPKL